MKMLPALFLVLVLLASVGLTPSMAQEVFTLVAVDMQPLVADIQDSALVEKTFSVNVDVKNVTGLWGWQFTLRYNATLLTAETASLGSFWQGQVLAGRAFQVPILIDDAAGSVSTAVTLIPPNTPRSTTGIDVLATVSFAVDHVGTGSLTISDEILVDQNVNPISHNLQHGSVEVTNNAPIASFAFTPNPPKMGETIIFDASASTDSGGSISDYAWDFDEDGVIDLTGVQVQTSFADEGNHTVTLQVTDNLGATGLARDPVQLSLLVNNQPSHTFKFVLVNTAPVADFTFSPVPGIASQPITFDASTTTDRENNIVSYVWDFGDGSPPVTLSSFTTSHTYQADATYQVILNVTDSRDSFTTKQQPVTVGPAIHDAAVTGVTPSLIQATVGTGVSIQVKVNNLGNVPENIRLDILANGVVVRFLTLTNFAAGAEQSRAIVWETAGSVVGQYTISARATIASDDDPANDARTGGTLTLLSAQVVVLPAQVTNKAKGTSFTVNVNTTAASLFGWQFRLNYDTSLISTTRTSVTLGPFWQSAVTQRRGFPVVTVDDTTGFVRVAFALLADPSSGVLPPSFNGTGTLASIGFTVEAYGRADLHLTEVTLVYGIGGGLTVPSAFTDAVFDNRLPHDVAITAISTSASSATIGTTVTVQVTLVNKGLNSETITLIFTAGTRQIGERQVSLNPGDTTTVSLEWNTQGFMQGSYQMTATATISGEGNSVDNTLSGDNVSLQTGGAGFDLNAYLLPITGGIAGLIAAGAAYLVVKRRRARK